MDFFTMQPVAQGWIIFLIIAVLGVALIIGPDATKLNSRQRAFIPSDGCFENVYLLDHMISEGRSKKSKLFLVGIDISKALIA